jgi:hypothetical protein
MNLLHDKVAGRAAVMMTETAAIASSVLFCI